MAYNMMICVLICVYFDFWGARWLVCWLESRSCHTQESLCLYEKCLRCLWVRMYSQVSLGGWSMTAGVCVHNFKEEVMPLLT
jgi:hypothetical protein